MKPEPKTIRKIIAYFLAIWGLVLLTFISYSWVNFFNRFSNSGASFSITASLVNLHSNILPQVLAIVAGILLFMNKKAGWILSICICIYNPLLALYFFKQATSLDGLSIALSVIVLILFTACFILLTRKQLRPAFNTHKLLYASGLFILLLLITDKLLTVYLEKEKDRQYVEQLLKGGEMKLPQSLQTTPNISIQDSLPASMLLIK